MTEHSKHHRIRPDLAAKAATLRKNATQPERALWFRLRRSQLQGLKFRLQHMVGPYIVDFYCPAKRLVVEVDGESHVGCGQDDEHRDSFLRSRGMSILRVTNDQVLRDLDAVCEAIARAAEAGADSQPDDPPSA